MPVSKSKRKKVKAASRPPVGPPPFDTADGDMLLGDELADELDTEAATAELWRAGQRFRPEQLDQAQEIAADAWDAPDPHRRLELATRALKICPWCGDAYGVLAADAPPGSDIAVHLWRMALAAAEFALKAEMGEDVFEAYAGEFWGHYATRPYMRARAGLSNALWAFGDREAAVAHDLELLRLNPNDNQGTRYAAAARLLALSRERALEELLQSYADEDVAFFAFARAALSFRKEGDSEQSRQLLANAIAMNRYVPTYLLGRQRMPRTSPDGYSNGSKEEAILYVEMAGDGWKSIPGALVWLSKRARR